MIIFSEKIALSPGTVPLKVKPHGAWNRGEMGEHKDSKSICIGFVKRGYFKVDINSVVFNIKGGCVFTVASQYLSVRRKSKVQDEGTTGECRTHVHRGVLNTGS